MIFYKTIISIFLSIIFGVSSAVAQASYGDIQLLINERKYEEALKLTDEQLSGNSSDIKLQFMRGLILTRMDRYNDAEQVFIKLTEENPDLPEPFNNLAVVYAAQGKYSEASEALKSAINTHPSYATAHENLGDIYAKMASRAYNQALELDTSNTTAREKLSLVNELISAPAISKPEKTIVSTATPEVKPVVKPAPKTRAKTVQEPEIITIPAKPTPEKAKASAKVNQENEKSRSRDAVEISLKSWANAWSAQDVDSYLASYGREFVPPKGLSRSAWENERRIRLRKPRYIKVSLSDIKINLHGKDYAEVRFTQTYLSDTYGDKVRKEILMRRVNERWLITQERTR